MSGPSAGSRPGFVDRARFDLEAELDFDLEVELDFDLEVELDFDLEVELDFSTSRSSSISISARFAAFWFQSSQTSTDASCTNARKLRDSFS
jgi:hypothetical protein